MKMTLVSKSWLALLIESKIANNRCTSQLAVTVCAKRKQRHPARR